jgi:UDP:flavonoid glycosyltransferase YjiC (YdhE family)
MEALHGGISADLALVATFPQLEYPRSWPANAHVTGPMEFEIPHPEIELPEGEGPLVLVAPSTAQDRDLRLIRVALAALAEEPVRVVATMNRLIPGEPKPEAPGNAAVVDWLSYSQVMPQADLVVTHGGHGTVCRALGAGTPVLCCPAVGDMAENGARVAWAGAGLTLPWRLTRPLPLRAAVRRILGDRGFARRTSEIAAWARNHDGAQRGAELIESLVST